MAAETNVVCFIDCYNLLFHTTITNYTHKSFMITWLVFNLSIVRYTILFHNLYGTCMVGWMELV